MSHDVIIVGARCAGATLATYLARAGVKTLLLEAQPRFSDMPMSTHFLQPPGMAILDELGLGDALRAVTPPAPTLRFRVGGHDACVTQPLERAGCCPRRLTLDPLLQRAAIDAGAEFRDQTRVVDLVREGERVAGVVVDTPQGRQTLRSRLVVGADGRNSTVARLTGVEEYLKFPMTRSAYWHYRTQPDLWRTDSRYTGFQGHIDYHGTGIRAAFRCDNDTMVMVSLVPHAEAPAWKTDDLMRTQTEYLSQIAVMRPLLEASEPITRVRSLVKADFFYRRPVGPGFALIGDAGTFKDFATGMGIASAMVSAKAMSATILDGSEAAFLHYWRARDVESLPLYFDALRLGEADVNDAFLGLLFENLARSPALTARLAAVSARTLSPLNAFTTGELLRMVIPALLRGRFDVLVPFLRTGRKIAGYKRELAYRERLLRELDAGDAGQRMPTSSSVAQAAQ